MDKLNISQSTINILILRLHLTLFCHAKVTELPSEGKPDGYASLTDELRQELGPIAMMNDMSESFLGSGRQFKRFKPASTMRAYSDQMRAKFNDTEKFVDKVCTEEDLQYVMRQIRKSEGKGEEQEFWKELARVQADKAGKARKKTAENAEKRRKELERMQSIGLELDYTTLERMTVAALKDQFKIYKERLKDPLLKKLAVSNLSSKFLLHLAVAAALSRHLSSLPDGDNTPASADDDGNTTSDTLGTNDAIDSMDTT